jgi:hypothetical protein
VPTEPTWGMSVNEKVARLARNRSTRSASSRSIGKIFAKVWACIQEVTMKSTRYRLACGAMLFLVGTTSVSAQEQEVSCEDVPMAVHATFTHE